MFTPAVFKETDRNTLLAFIEQYPLGTLVSQTMGGLTANHIPFRIHQGDNGKTFLQSHIAKANPLWQHLDGKQAVLLIFNGPNAYVSPNFYPSKAEHGRAVPTWNYAVVHVKGTIRVKHDGQWIMHLLTQISNEHEQDQATPWSLEDAPKHYIDRLANAVVGIEVEVSNIVGNFKLSQNKSAADIDGVITGLDKASNEARQLAEKMRALNSKT